MVFVDNSQLLQIQLKNIAFLSFHANWEHLLKPKIFLRLFNY